MNTTDRIIHPNKVFSNKVKAAMLLKNYSIAEWARENGFSNAMCCNVIRRLITAKMQSPVTDCFKIIQALKRDGFWPEEEEEQ